MTDETAAAPVVQPVAEDKPIGYNYGLIAKWMAAIALSVSVLGLEIAGFAPKGTYIAMVAGPGLAALGLHAAAKSLT